MTKTKKIKILIFLNLVRPRENNLKNLETFTFFLNQIKNIWEVAFSFLELGVWQLVTSLSKG